MAALGPRARIKCDFWDLWVNCGPLTSPLAEVATDGDLLYDLRYGLFRDDSCVRAMVREQMGDNFCRRHTHDHEQFVGRLIAILFCFLCFALK